MLIDDSEPGDDDTVLVADVIDETVDNIVGPVDAMLLTLLSKMLLQGWYSIPKKK